MRTETLVSTSDGYLVVYRGGERYRTVERHYVAEPASLVHKRASYVLRQVGMAAGQLPRELSALPADA